MNSEVKGILKTFSVSTFHVSQLIWKQIKTPKFQGENVMKCIFFLEGKSNSTKLTDNFLPKIGSTD